MRRFNKVKARAVYSIASAGSHRSGYTATHTCGVVRLGGTTNRCHSDTSAAAADAQRSLPLQVGLRDRPIGLCSTRQQRPSQSRRRPSRCNGCNGYNSGLAAVIRQECTTTVCRTAVWHWDGRWSSKCSCSRRRSTPARARPTRCVCCIAYVVHCMSLVACPALNAACCMWHVARCTVVALSTAAGRRDDALARLPPRRTATAGNLRTANPSTRRHVASRTPVPRVIPSLHSRNMPMVRCNTCQPHAAAAAECPRRAAVVDG